MDKPSPWVASPYVSPARFSPHNVMMPNPVPVYRYSNAHKLTQMQKQHIACDLLREGIKPRHIRKCIGISNRQLKKGKRLVTAQPNA